MIHLFQVKLYLQLKVGGINEMFSANEITPWKDATENEEAKQIFWNNTEWLQTWNLNNCEYSSSLIIDYFRIWAI